MDYHIDLPSYMAMATFRMASGFTPHLLELALYIAAGFPCPCKTLSDMGYFKIIVSSIENLSFLNFHISSYQRSTL